jgi:hypothetical protein
MSYDDIQDIIDEGLGFAADELGPPHDVYRVGPSSSGDVIQESNKIASGVNIFTKVAYGAGARESLETEKQQGIIWEKVIADMRPYRVGDVFVLNDPVLGQGYSSVNFATTEFKGFALADHSPLKKALAGRLNCTVNIFRPGAGVNADDQFDRTVDNAAPVILSNGTFSLGQVNALPSRVPAGLMALRSYGERMFDQSPAEKRRSAWMLYTPALKGFTIHEGDRIIGPDGARYVVIIPYTQQVGATGSQWFLEREAPGA